MSGQPIPDLALSGSLRWAIQYTLPVQIDTGQSVCQLSVGRNSSRWLLGLDGRVRTTTFPLGHDIFATPLRPLGAFCPFIGGPGCIVQIAHLSPTELEVTVITERKEERCGEEEMSKRRVADTTISSTLMARLTET